MKHILSLGAIALLVGCTQQQLPAVIDMPYCDANRILPATELTQIERTDSTTVLTFSTMYDYHDYSLKIGAGYRLWFGDFSTPMKELVVPGEVDFDGNKISVSQGVPAQFRMIFAALPKDVESVDLVQEVYGNIKNAIWGIDLTGKRSPNELPAEIPAELLNYNFATGNLPQVVTKEDVVKITAHAVAWRSWMKHDVEFIVNTVDDTQERIKAYFNDSGVVTIDIPLKGTASISAHTPYNTYANFYAEPGEEINLYILPDNNSETQRGSRPNGVIDGKYRNVKAMEMDFVFYQEDADTLLYNKTDPNDYFTAMMKIHSDGLDSIQAGNYEPDKEKYARAVVDRHMMSQTLRPDAYTTNDWMQSYSVKPDSVLRFSPDQLRQIRESIDFTNPLLEVISIGNPGSRSRFLKAKELILAE